MKFGFGFVPTMPIAESIKIVQRGEELGYDMIWIPDQTFYRDPFLVMAAWAGATKSVELMIGVTNPFTRHPAQIARTMATLAEMTDGRANLGIGAGNRRELLLPMGHEQIASAPRTREMAQIVRSLLNGETVDYRSAYVVADGIQLQWTPPATQTMIYVAGRGSKMLEVAGEVGDGAVIGALASPAGLNFAKDAIKRGAERGGRTVDQVELVSWVTFRVVDDMNSIKDRLKASVAHIIGGAPDYLLTAIGLEEDFIQRLKATYAEGGGQAAAIHITDREIDMLTVVGDADAVKEKVQRMADHGVDQIGVLLTESTIEANIKIIEKIAKTIIPHFR